MEALFIANSKTDFLNEYFLYISQNKIYQFLISNWKTLKRYL